MNITIVEDIFESSRLSPVMARNDFDFHPSTQWNINGDDFGSNGDDVDDFGEYEVDTEGDIDDIPLLEASMELQAYLVEGESTPETTMDPNRLEASLDTNEEISQTIAIGERIGFQLKKFQEDIRNIIKKRRILTINSRGVSGEGSSAFLCETVDPIGLSGGIASLWDPSAFKCSVTIKGQNFLEIKGTWITSNVTYGFINVYVPNDPTRRKTLWSNLENVISSDDNIRWVVFGDFNAVRSADEIIGSIFRPSNAYYFKKFNTSVDLINLPIGGRKFMYMSSDCSKHSKLDCFLISHNHLTVMALPRLHSNHCPLILSSPVSDFGAPPFRFFNAWLLEDELEGVVKQGWELTKEIDSIDTNAKSHSLDESKIEYRKNLHKEMMDLEAKCILDLKQKSRCKWALEGAENSGFYHVIDRGCNSSFIILFPKTSDPISLSEYRPIGLIRCIYKIIAKVLAERMKVCIPHVVSQTQTAFIKDRNILDDPLIINEVISWLRKNKSKAFLFKVDFEKAFDCLNWNYLDSVMAQMNFGQKWRNWILGCLSSALASVIINGSASKEFSLMRGVRQDPCLNIELEEAKEQGIFQGKTQKKKLVNMAKSKLFGLGVSEVELDWLSRRVNCSIGNLSFIYLGMLVGASMSRLAHWNPLITKFQTKLSKWKATNFWFGGRLTLCAASSGVAPLRKEGCHGSHGIKLCPKKDGGLDIGSLKAHNLALLGKRWWRFTSRKHELWKDWKGHCWGNIVNLHNYLSKDNLDLCNLFSQLSVRQDNNTTWRLEPSGMYIVASLRRFIDKTLLPKTPAGAWQWNNLVPGKVNILAWRDCHRRLPTRIFDHMSIYNIDVESESHLLTECLISQEVWHGVQKWWYTFPLSFGSLNEILQCRNLALGSDNLHQIQEAVVLIYIWVFWKFRNDRIHSNTIKSHKFLANEVQLLIHLWINSRCNNKKFRWTEWCCDLIAECKR
uniref:Reverse transcriptase domain-containing protein n=1 Tax=Lactuca sativa TaxID=4236 RepID=A0A9R1WB95_LACSA|nr:hypothetical protein LSAT_V11C300114670 [Lactuca sativa]